MTQTNDPPTVLDIGLIPNSNEKADLNAPSDSGGKLVTNQAPNITITETAVVADSDERLALDVQEGDIAIQTNVSSSFIFTGGDNVANNWQTIDFDAVGAIDGEDINPSGISGANINSASDGQLLESDGNGQLQFSSPAGGVPTGGIIMWSGSIANIPSGFALCDGTNGTPDLTDRFVVGAGGSEAVGDTGGTDTQSVNVSVSGTTDRVRFQSPRITILGDAGPPFDFGPHTDGLTYFTRTDTKGFNAAGSFGSFDSRDVLQPKANFSGSGSDTFDNRAAYYALAYIMKT